ncbi:Bug family tripartite tricarboxylate transporter substrate binding protein [Xanthobacter tagetidis]|jgi:tripartite-type tricarboxylate transporter receptor subunit TctC|uniref:Tripartite tricarboxylate transporter substrate binding protein n=1 Tax=Xanthobacter tagetidis TaxID=60216 RepID=A0A3L7A5T2_9HYPH|nr:tripartite tricarboxylate transporter substrate binding protein [Xanthobacter tagetidis]MBB6308863.1 tripartite-type tricarboxylate transporter receptor subunit TctC [Xanthobacter tagetidis]RLP74911.1 tripartite tricarboxylate transporter substrate binding protein [Xanthobacter tagetidis]
MLRISRAAVALALAALCATGVVAQGRADDFPTKPIRWIVPFSPGGATDIVARVVGQKMQEAWGQPVVVENKPGAGGTLATELIARAAPDGYTIGGISLNFTMYPFLYPSFPFNIQKDFTPITLVARIPSILVVTPAMPVNSVEDLIRAAKASPGKIGFASGGGVGTGGHVAGELFKKMTGVEMTHIPYKGGGPATADLIGGHVQTSFATTTSIVEAIRANKVRPIAVTSATRFPLFPDLPTVAESGVPGFVTEEMQGIIGPAGMPKPIVDKLNREIVRILNLPEVRDRLVNLGATPVAGTPAEFADYLRTESAKWAEVFKGSGITAE